VTSYTDADGNTSATSYDLDGRPVSVNDGKGTTSYTYDSASEHRGLPTSLDTGLGANPSVFSGSYDADGNLVSQTYPNGFTATSTFDNAGQRTGLTYTAGATSLLSFTASYGADGKIQGSATPGGTETYRYDNAGRLATVNDVTSGGGTTACDTRGYGYNVNSDRTSYTDTPGDAAGNCLTTGGTTTSHSYDEADRFKPTTESGYSYDAFGRTLTVPSADAGGAGDLSLGYYTNDMVHTQTVAGHTKTWTLDPTGRLRTQNDSASAITDTNHYTDASDSPAWIGTLTGGGTSSWTRNVEGVTGDLAATIDNTGTVVLQLTNLHGDVVATADDATGASAVTAYFESTEFGIPRSGATTQRYAWLGGKRRSSDSLGGLTLMGVRLYDPATGRFLQTDPVPGGSANNYDYVYQDPINKLDLNGQCWTCWAKKAVSSAAGFVSKTAAGWASGVERDALYYTSFGVALKGTARIARLGSRSLGFIAAGVGQGVSDIWEHGLSWGQRAGRIALAGAVGVAAVAGAAALCAGTVGAGCAIVAGFAINYVARRTMSHYHVSRRMGLGDDF
jgi:RHS repeat-associated protein